MTTTTTPTAAARVSGTIKALEWRDGAEFCGQPMSYAETEFGLWMIVAYTGRDGRWTPCDPTGNDSDDDWATADEAKASAEEEHNARILAAIQPDPEPVDPISDYWDGRSAYRTATGSPHDFTAPAMPRDQLSPEARKDWLLNGAPRVWLEVDGGGPWFVKPVQPSREYLRADLATPSSAGMVSVEPAANDTISQEAAIARDKLHHADEFLGSDLAAILKDYDRLVALRALAGEGGR